MSPTKGSLATRRWKEAHLEQWREASKRYRETHQEKIQVYRDTHREQRRTYAQAEYAAAKAAGQCVRCNQPSREGRVICAACHQKQLGLQRRNKYGIMEAEVAGLMESQDSRCAICMAFIETDAHVDHDHESREVRGLLCGSCNRGLGQFRDSPEALEKAAAYLRNWRKS